MEDAARRMVTRVLKINKMRRLLIYPAPNSFPLAAVN